MNMDYRQVKASSHPGQDSVLGFLGHVQRISRHVADGERSHVLNAAVEIPVQCLRVDKAILLGRSPTGDFCRPLAHNSVSDFFLDNCHRLSTDAVLDWVVTNQAPRTSENVADSPAHPSDLYAREGVASIACIPVVAQGQTVALLLGMSSSPVSLTVLEMEILHAIANHVAAALNSPAILDVADGALPGLPIAKKWLKGIAHPSRDLPGVLDRTLEAIIALLQAESGSIVLSYEGDCRLVASSGLDIADLSSAKPTVAASVLAGRKPVLLHGPLDPERFPDANPRKEIASSALVPLRGRKGPIGLLSVNRTTSGRLFGEQELALTDGLGCLVAAAVENSDMHSTARTQTRYLNSLYKIARSITSELRLDSVIDMIMDHLQDLVPSDICAVLLRDEETGEITVAHGRGLETEDLDKYDEITLPIRTLPASRKRPLSATDMTTYDTVLRSPETDRLELRSAVAVPLLVRNKRIGYLALYRRRRRGFSRMQVKLLVGLSELAASAIQNARMYGRQLGIADITKRLITPDTPGSPPGFDVGAKYSPAYKVGGDYYELIRLDDRRYAVAIADVSGRDVSGAAHIAMCKHSLRAIAEHMRSPSALLRKMNRLIYEGTEPESFISLFYGVLDTERRVLRYSSGGHEPALIYRAGTGKSKFVTTTGLLLGISPDATFSERRTSIQSGDIVLLYTDGLMDAISPDSKVGLSRLEECVSRWALKSAQEIADNIHREAIEGCTGRSPDDIALVVLKAS